MKQHNQFAVDGIIDCNNDAGQPNLLDTIIEGRDSSPAEPLVKAFSATGMVRTVSATFTQYERLHAPDLFVRQSVSS